MSNATWPTPGPSPSALGSGWGGSRLPSPSHSDSRVHAVSALSFSSSRKPDLSSDIGLLGQPKDQTTVRLCGLVLV